MFFEKADYTFQHTLAVSSALFFYGRGRGSKESDMETRKQGDKDEEK